MEAGVKALKYFRPVLESKLFLNLKVLIPIAFLEYTLDDIKSKYCYNAGKFDNIVKKHSIPELLEQIANQCHLVSKPSFSIVAIYSRNMRTDCSLTKIK